MEIVETEHTDEMSAVKVDGDLLLTETQWDKRMRLTITKDFNKTRAHIFAGGLLAKDDCPAQRKFTCIICQQAFLNASDCLTHVRTHSEEPQELNTYGSVQVKPLHIELTEKMDELNNTNVDVGDNENMKCELSDGEECVISSTDTNDLKRHLKNQSYSVLKARKQHRCKLCVKTFLDLKVLKQHCRQDHPNEKMYMCSICSLSFPTKKSLAVHKFIHADHHPLKCKMNGCDGTFSNKAALNRHQKTHSDERPHVCPHCSKAFKLRNHLREHVRLHTGEKPFVCEVCGAGFAQSNGLKSHAKQHSLERENQCDICHKAFSRPQLLDMHRKVHDGEKPFSCDQCHQTFREAANLGSHKKLKHELANRRGEKHFTCDVCGASFSQACNLGIHKKKKHSSAAASQIKTFVCDICDAKFSEACNLGVHKKIKHTEQSEDGRTIFSCGICGAKFYRESNLSGHKKRKHGVIGN